MISKDNNNLSNSPTGIDLHERKSSNNSLENSSSPYLRQHANNPVNWHEWGDEALELAKKNNKPLLVSIGYAACHWCHVMAHESFMDIEIAEYMNKHFICIKVDREERPDIDKIYMEAANLLSARGGWPLNAFALPDGSPFFAGTYYIKTDWLHLLKQVDEVFHKKHNIVIEQSNTLINEININKFNNTPLGDYYSINFTNTCYIEIYEQWKTMIDWKLGGFRGAPKFPLPIAWEFMLQYHHLTGNKESLKSVEITLDSIAEGGIYDQIGGGFCRYSVDELWKTPHFEKMLYDNGQLVSLYSHAFQVTQKERYAEIIVQTLEFIERELMSMDGVFYSSLNADSENEEGRYYVWAENEVDRVLNKSSAKLIKEYYQISETGNWEQGKNILFPKSSIPEFALNNKLTLENFNFILNTANRQLFNSRKKRTRPSTDDKIIVSWNALMISGYIDAYKALNKHEHLDTALKCGNFIKSNMILENGKLKRNYKEGKSGIDAFLDDYALLANSFLDLYQLTFNINWLNTAKNLIDYVIKNFIDEKTNLYYYTLNNSERLFARSKEITDNVIPASNSILANVMYKLGYYFSNKSYLTRAETLLHHVKTSISTGGPYYANWANLLGMVIFKPYEIAVIGKEADVKNRELQKHYLPLSIITGGESENLPSLKGKFKNNSTMIYICKNKSCKEPTEDPHKALIQIVY